VRAQLMERPPRCNAARRPAEGRSHDILNHRPPHAGRKGKIMKKIINGKLYDTETAKLIASRSSGGSGSFSDWSECLYKKRTGEYFLHGEGGPMTKYSRQCGDNSWGWGERITPLSYDEAVEFAEKAMTADEYMAEFGPVSEGERVTLSVSLDAAVADRIRKAAAAAGISVSECIASKF